MKKAFKLGEEVQVQLVKGGDMAVGTIRYIDAKNRRARVGITVDQPTAWTDSRSGRTCYAVLRTEHLISVRTMYVWSLGNQRYLGTRINRSGEKFSSLGAIAKVTKVASTKRRAIA